MANELAFIGDLHFNKMLSGEFFKSRMDSGFAIYSVSTLSTFKSYKRLLPHEVRFLVVGCLPALLVELKPSKVETREVTIKRLMVDFGSALFGLLDVYPELRLIVVRPTLRSIPSHFKTDLVHMERFMASLETGDVRIRVTSQYAVDASMLMKDGITLTSSAVNPYLDDLASQVLESVCFFKARQASSGAIVTLDANLNEVTPARAHGGPHSSFDSSLTLPEAYSTPQPPQQPASSRAEPKSGPCYQAVGGREPILSRDATTEEIVDVVNNLYSDFLDKCIEDNHLLANQLDVNDGEMNARSATKVVISGFKGTTYPEDPSGQQSLLRPIIDPIVNLVLGKDVEYVIYPRRGVIRGTTLPPCEVEFKTAVQAQRFRMEAARLSRAKHEGLSHLYFNPCITLATRVRMEVLRSLANRVSNSRLLTYCVSNGPRPKLSVGPAPNYPGRRVAYFYVDAIRRYGHLLADDFLDKAYDRAQMFFTGELERTFLVLREKVAVKRLKQRDGEEQQPLQPEPQPGPPPAPAPVVPAQPDGRSFKRKASTEAGTSSKRS